MNGKTYELALVSGVEGPCVSLNNYRIAGPKPWGGGQVTRSWQVTERDLLNAVPELIAEERDRIRTALEDWISEQGVNREGYPGADTVTWINADDLIGVLESLVFPEGCVPAHGGTTSPSTTSS